MIGECLLRILDRAPARHQAWQPPTWHKGICVMSQSGRGTINKGVLLIVLKDYATGL